MKIRSRCEQRDRGTKMMGMRILHIAPLLQARIVLLKGIAVQRIVQKNVKFEYKSNSDRLTNPSALNVSPLAHDLL